LGVLYIGGGWASGCLPHPSGGPPADTDTNSSVRQQQLGVETHRPLGAFGFVSALGTFGFVSAVEEVVEESIQ
jgi:hypothetical protein